MLWITSIYVALRNDTGKGGEERAAEYLVTRGYVVRDVNWRNGKYELDIVAYKDGVLVVVEVRPVHRSSICVPKMRLRGLSAVVSSEPADAYVRHYDLPFDVRFDVIALIKKNDGTYDIEHIEDAFFPTLR